MIYFRGCTAREKETSKPIATISYNTEDYLVYKLNELIKAHKICDYYFIKHKAEKDEAKDHIHLWLKPNTLLDTMDLQNHFKEIDPNNLNKPLGCIDFVSSKLDDFILYGLHLEQYLKFKGENREYHYLKSDFRYYDENTFEEVFNHAIKGSDFAKRFQLLQMLNDETLDPIELINSGLVSFNQSAQVAAYQRLKNDSLFRNGRKTHTPKDND